MCHDAGRPEAHHVLIKTHAWSADWDLGRAAHIFITHRDLRQVSGPALALAGREARRAGAPTFTLCTLHSAFCFESKHQPGLPPAAKHQPPARGAQRSPCHTRQAPRWHLAQPKDCPSCPARPARPAHTACCSAHPAHRAEFGASQGIDVLCRCRWCGPTAAWGGRRTFPRAMWRIT
jgi:hypothetical protein